MELSNKTIIITGASSGIGAAAARLFVAEGAKVILGARREAELEALTSELNDDRVHAVSLAGDVKEPAYAGALVRLAQTRFGGLAGAFNNAGMVGEMTPVPEMSEANWQDVIATNLTSAFHAAKAQLPVIAEGGGGSIVFTSSFVGHSNGGMPGMAAYAAAKAGLIGFAKSLASDHASEGIRVSTILPGGTKTPMAGDDPETHALVANLHPLKRMAEPNEIAEAAMFLLSDRSRFMTGSPMFVDGGISVRLL